MAKLTKEAAISKYRKLKKEKKHYKKRITRAEFSKETGISKYRIDNLFGSYGAFADIAEESFREKLPENERALLSEKRKVFDEDATKEECIEDLRRVQEENPTKYITRNFYRINGKYSDATWDRHFGTMEEFRSQAKIQLSRPQRKLERDIAKHASVDHYEEYYNTQVAPYYRKFEKTHLPSKLKRIMAISDVHDIECDEFTLEVFVSECKRKQPDIIVLNGDIFDLYEFSRYGQDPRHIRIKERFEFIHKRLFAKLRQVCPDAQIDFIMGNHEYRLIKHLADATPNLRVLLSDVMGITFSKVFGLDAYQINWVSKFDLTAFTKSDITDIMKQNHKIYFDAFAFTHEPDETIKRSYSGSNGHHHSASLESGFNLHTGVTYWTQTPSAHVRDAEYLAKVSKWNTGFLEVVINTELKQAIQRIHSTYDKWTEIDGVYYERKQI